MAKKKLHGIETIRKMNEQTSTITEGASKGKETAVIVVHSKSDSQEASDGDYTCLSAITAPERSPQPTSGNPVSVGDTLAVYRNKIKGQKERGIANSAGQECAADIWQRQQAT